MNAPESDWIEVRLNGKNRRVPPNQNVAGLLAELGLDPTGVVVEIDGNILPADQYQVTILTATAQIEIVHFVGGG